ncbi:MAG: hypothetical protein ABR611_12615 [Chthoniobacterales bacterium]
MKIKSFLSISLIAVALPLSVDAATCSVPAGYPTIQAAVDDPTCDTVNVAPGAYAENVFISHAVTLNGAQAGQPTTGRSSGGPNESTVVGANSTGAHAVFVINASSVTIDGFTVKNSVITDAAIGIQIRPSHDSVVLNNFIDGITTADVTPAGRAMGVHLQNGLINVNVGSNDIRNVVSSGTATGIQFGDNDATSGIDISLMQNNNISGVISSAGSASAVICTKATLTATAFYFQKNHVSDLTGATSVHAVSVEADVNVPLIIENDFTNLNSPSGDVAAIWFNNVPRVMTADCSGNFFFIPARAYGVEIVGSFDPAFPPPMSAGCNWWNSPDGPGPVGPGHGCLVSPNVRYSPWRVTPSSDVSACVGNNVPMTEADCKNGGWITHVRPDGSSFKSQGDCMQFINNSR